MAKASTRQKTAWAASCLCGFGGGVVTVLCIVRDSMHTFYSTSYLFKVAVPLRALPAPPQYLPAHAAIKDGGADQWHEEIKPKQPPVLTCFIHLPGEERATINCGTVWREYYSTALQPEGHGPQLGWGGTVTAITVQTLNQTGFLQVLLYYKQKKNTACIFKLIYTEKYCLCSQCNGK